LQAGLRANAQAHQARIQRERERTLVLVERARRAMDALLWQRDLAIERCGGLLSALSHRGVLARGFALVRDLNGRPLRAAAAISPGLRMDIEFTDGRVRAQAEGVSISAPAASPPKRRRRGSLSTPGQGNLFDP
jgi:exodeoxyribonuclease VII large subunit